MTEAGDRVTRFSFNTLPWVTLTRSVTVLTENTLNNRILNTGVNGS